jgi:BMFP domain-containing protein YqiC
MSNDPTIPPTQPTLETILGRINALGESLSAEIVKVRTDLSAEIAKVRSDLSAEIGKVRNDLSAEIQSFRAETLEKLAKIDEKFEVITDDLLEIRAKQKQHGKRLNELERKVS